MTTLPTADVWALVEIMGFRQHYGRVTEVERFGAKMMRIDAPTKPAMPLFGEDEEFETHYYGGAAIFGMTPMTEEACRAFAARARPRPVTPRAALPPPDWDDPDFEEIETPGNRVGDPIPF